MKNLTQKNEETYKKICDIALAFGGQCLSTELTNYRTKLEFICKHGHKWFALGNSIKNGHWCPTCFHLSRRKINGHIPTIEDMKNIAHSHKGQCLSIEYINISHKLLWRCEKEHEWLAVPASIIKGSWCPKCYEASKVRYTIEDVRKIAAEHGYECLSTVFHKSSEKLEMKCKYNHQWSVSLDRLKRGARCPVCREIYQQQHQKYDLEFMTNLAESHGGKCLSDVYIPREKQRWECKNGHQWEAKLTTIRRGSWCSICSNISKKLTIEEMQEIANEKGGKCLSTIYINSKSKLKWECAKAHQWESYPYYIKQGYWCSICKKQEHQHENHKD